MTSSCTVPEFGDTLDETSERSQKPAEGSRLFGRAAFEVSLGQAEEPLRLRS